MKQNESKLEVYKLNISVKNRMTNIRTPVQILIYSLIVAKIDNNLKIKNISDNDLILNISKREVLENINLVKLQSNFKQQMEELSKLQIEHHYTDTNSFRFINVFSYIDYNNGILTVKINRDIISYFIDFNGSSFLKYHFKYLVKFKSKYTMLLYELIQSDYYKLKREYHFDYDYNYLLQQLQVKSPSMKQFFNFRIKILEKSLKEINEKTNINIKYKKLLNSKTVEKIRFLPISKSSKIKETIFKDTLTQEQDKKIKYLENDNSASDAKITMLKYDLKIMESVNNSYAKDYRADIFQEPTKEELDNLGDYPF